MSGAAPGIARIHSVSRQARQHSLYISIYGWRGNFEGDAGNGSGGVGANTRQRTQLGDTARQMPSVLSHDLQGGCMQCAGTAIITKAAPSCQDVIGFCSRQRLHTREEGQESAVMRD